MLYDSIENLSAYHTLLPGIAVAEAFLAHPALFLQTESRKPTPPLSKTDPDFHTAPVAMNALLSLPLGKTELGAGVSVTVSAYDPKTENRFEAHRNYIDLQYVLSGCEDMFCALEGDAYGARAYDAETDVHFWDGAERAVHLTLSEGQFALFFPQDIHKPGIRNADYDGTVRKLVFKIPTPAYEPTAHFLQLSRAIHLPEDVTSAAAALTQRIPHETFRSLIDAFFVNPSEAPYHDGLADTYGVSVPLCNLAVYMQYARETFYHYLEKGISSDIYYDSMTDFTVWNRACVRKTGEGGLLQIGWLCNTLRESLYRLGRFQYQPTTFDHKEYRFGKYVITEGDPVITIHIPEGEPLTDEVRMDSYRRAEAFFGSHVFVCESWLFYPAHREFLQKNSNIVRFMDDFVMLSSHERRGELGDMWRIYGFSCDHTDFANLPEQTGMQRTYKKHLLESGGMTGGGYGILIMENGEILR